MNFKQLEYFVAVADAGSISSAARSLHISQPPLSTQMHLLEEELGQSLFERGSRSIKLTDAGRFFYERAQSILDMAEGTRKDMEQLGKGLIGALRLGMISSVQTGPVIESIILSRQNHPGVLFRIYEGNTYQLLDKLSTGQIHAALVRTPFPEDGLECRYLVQEPMVAVGQESFFGNEESSISLASLACAGIFVYLRRRPFLPDLGPGGSRCQYRTGLYHAPGQREPENQDYFSQSFQHHRSGTIKKRRPFFLRPAVFSVI